MVLSIEENKVVRLISDAITSSGSIWLEGSMLYQWANKRRVSLRPLSFLIDQNLVRQLRIDGRCYYTLPHYDMWETYTAYDAMRILSRYHSSVSDDRIEHFILEAEDLTGKKLHEQQRAAVYMAVQCGICVITGGPGTGKTCVLEILTYVLQHIIFDIDIRFTAPTGKAARRITESTGNPAKTTQKELGILAANPYKKMFGGDVLICDEVSMADQETIYYVLRAIANGQKIIIVGDIDQLPSVGPGAVLRDLIDSGVIPTVMLTKTFRQANDSNIFGNIMKIKNGESELTAGEDFEIVPAGKEPLSQLVDLYLKEYARYGPENIACLLPYRKSGILCSDNFNNVIQNIVNPINNRPHLVTTTERGMKIRLSAGDPVMQLKNREECANGDVGMVESCKFGKLTVKFSDGRVVYNHDTVGDLCLAYGMSIHKSQGSEYQSVLVGVTMAHKSLLYRNLLYTGVTRAKERCVLLQDEKAVRLAIQTEEQYARCTFLTDKLSFYHKKLCYCA